MTLSKYLTGIPPEAQPQALRAAAESIYSQHLELLKDIHTLPKPQQAEAIHSLTELKADAMEILRLGVLRGTPEHKLRLVDRLDAFREIAILKLAQREEARLKSINTK
jgi:hypothetical protein